MSILHLNASGFNVLYHFQNTFVMNQLRFSFGDGTDAKFTFTDATNTDALAENIAAIVDARKSARNLAGIVRKRDAWSGRRFHVSLILQGEDCTGHLRNLEFSANKTDYKALATWTLNAGKSLVSDLAQLEMSTLN